MIVVSDPVSFMKNLLKISYIFVLLGEIQYTFIMSQVFKDYLEISVSRDYFKTLPKNKLLSKLFSILVITHTREKRHNVVGLSSKDDSLQI